MAITGGDSSLPAIGKDDHEDEYALFAVFVRNPYRRDLLTVLFIDVFEDVILIADAGLGFVILPETILSWAPETRL